MNSPDNANEATRAKHVASMRSDEVPSLFARNTAPAEEADVMYKYNARLKYVRASRTDDGHSASYGKQSLPEQEA